ncbi:MAG: hypothetical protein Tsb005_18990 [Gammaproteobacteria bacterium]
MSQHHFYTQHAGERTHILLGWDKPLQGFFLVIHKPSDGDEPYWSNLATVGLLPHIDYFLQVLKTQGIDIPQPMIDAVLQDARDNVGNKQVTWSGV